MSIPIFQFVPPLYPPWYPYICSLHLGLYFHFENRLISVPLFISITTKVCLVKAMVFQVVMYVCESWTIKKTECWGIHAFELWCWIRVLRAPWSARISHQSILKEISPECSLEGLMLKLKLQYFGQLMQRADSLERPWCWERLKPGGEKGMTDNEMVGWYHQLYGDEFEQALGVGDGQGSLVCCSPWGSQESNTTWQLNTHTCTRTRTRTHTPLCLQQH